MVNIGAMFMNDTSFNHSAFVDMAALLLAKPSLYTVPYLLDDISPNMPDANMCYLAVNSRDFGRDTYLLPTRYVAGETDGNIPSGNTYLPTTAPV